MTALDRARAKQRTINAYNRIFNTPDGAAVMADIREAFGCDYPAFIPLQKERGTEYDPLHAAVRSGQRSVLLHIQFMASQAVKGDADITKPKSRVKRDNS